MKILSFLSTSDEHVLLFHFKGGTVSGRGKFKLIILILTIPTT